MIRAHQPGSQPIDIPETVPNPAVPQPVRAPTPPKQPVKIPIPANSGSVRTLSRSQRDDVRGAAKVLGVG